MAEIKIFLREPLGAFGSILFPVLVFVMAGRLSLRLIAATGFIRVGLPVFAAVLNRFVNLVPNPWWAAKRSKDCLRPPAGGTGNEATSALVP
jgi:hypothetical protein